MSIKSLAHICVKEADLDSVSKFYCDVLGLEKQFKFTKDGETTGFYLKVADGNFMEFFKQEADKKPGLDHFCLETDSIEELRERFVAAGFNPGEITLGADQSYQFWVNDPAGIAMEFHQYTTQSSQKTKSDVEVNW